MRLVFWWCCSMEWLYKKHFECCLRVTVTFVQSGHEEPDMAWKIHNAQTLEGPRWKWSWADGLYHCAAWWRSGRRLSRSRVSRGPAARVPVRYWQSVQISISKCNVISACSVIYEDLIRLVLYSYVPTCTIMYCVVCRCILCVSCGGN